MILARLKWLAVILPVAFLSLADYARHQLWPSTLHTPLGFFATHLVFAVAIYAFAGAIFRRIDAMHHQLALRNRLLSGLHAVGQVLGQSLELDQVLDRSLQQILQLTGADRAELLTGDDATGDLILRARVGAPILPGAVGARYADHVPAWPSATGEPWLVRPADWCGRPDFEVLQAAGLQAFASVPLKAKGRVVGLVQIGAQQPFAGDLREVLSALGTQIGMIIENAGLHQRVRETRDFLDSLIANSADGIITTDLQGRILSWNRGAEAIYGFTRAEAVGKTLPMVPPEEMAEARAALERLRAGESVLNLETRRRNRNGRLINVVVTACPVVDAQGQVTAFVGFSKDITERKQMQAQLEELALLQERERIGMDLHDGVIQSLYGVALQLEDCALHVEEAPRAVRQRLDRLGDDLNTVIQDIRSYIFRLRPDAAADSDFARGLEQLVQGFQVNSLVETRLAVDEGAGALLAPDQVTHLLQIAREALANVLRHAHSTRVQVSATVAGGRLELTIADNGVGMGGGERGPQQLGLRNMTARARAAGGDLSVDSVPGQGTRVSVRVPLGRGQEVAASG